MPSTSPRGKRKPVDLCPRMSMCQLQGTTPVLTRSLLYKALQSSRHKARTQRARTGCRRAEPCSTVSVCVLQCMLACLRACMNGCMRACACVCAFRRADGHACAHEPPHTNRRGAHAVPWNRHGRSKRPDQSPGSQELSDGGLRRTSRLLRNAALAERHSAFTLMFRGRHHGQECCCGVDFSSMDCAATRIVSCDVDHAAHQVRFELRVNVTLSV